jgi:hypothetical protein
MVKQGEIRERIWSLMEREGISRPPLPIRHRIPNFAGAERAAERLGEVRAFQRSRGREGQPGLASIARQEAGALEPGSS